MSWASRYVGRDAVSVFSSLGWKLCPGRDLINGDQGPRTPATRARAAKDTRLRLMNKYGHDALITMNHLGMNERVWIGLSKKAQDAMIKQLKRSASPLFERKIDFSKCIPIDSKINGKDAILLGGRVILEGDKDWLKALPYTGYAFDKETREETIARSKRNVEAGRERLDEHLKARDLHDLMTGRYAPLYKGYKGRRRKQVEALHDEDRSPLHGLYVKNRA